MEINHDDLPELGTRAAAVAAIESMMFRAIGAKDLEPVQLRYWLDAYYQVRRAQEIAERADGRSFAAFCADLIPKVQRGPLGAPAPTEETATPPHQSPAATASPRGEAKREEERRADVSAPPEQADVSGGQADAAETQQTAEEATSSVTADAVTPSPQGEGRTRQRPVGWTDDFEPVELKKSGAAEAAAYKREVLARLQEIRSRGVTVPQIVKVAEGNITEDQVRAILEARRVPVAVYRVLSAALDQIDK